MAQPVMFPGPPIDIGAQFQPHQRAASLLGAVRGLVGIECGVVSIETQTIRRSRAGGDYAMSSDSTKPPVPQLEAETTARPPRRLV